MKLWLILPWEYKAGDRIEENIRLSSKIIPRTAYLSYDDAVKAAQDVAQLRPKTPIYIFEATGAIETIEPKFLEKQFNKSGELLPK